MGALLAAALALAAWGADARASLDAEAARASGAADLASWWSRVGAPAWIPDAEIGAGFPWVFAGHAVAGWSLHEPLRAPRREPWPGSRAALAPAEWVEGASVMTPVAGAWADPGAGLARIEDSVAAMPAGAKPRVSMFSFARGSSAEERNALRLVQRDSLRRLVGEVTDWRRGGTGAWRDAAAHHYGLGFTVPWGRARWEGAFGNDGSAGSVTSGEEESATAYGAWGRVRAPLGGGEASLELGRDMDHRDSFGGVLLPGRRDAQRAHAGLEWSTAHAGGTSGARMTLSRSEVVQSVPGIGRAEWEDEALWMAARHRRPWAGGTLEAAFGAGSSSAAGALGIAPSVEWQGRVRGADVRLAAGRSQAPVWSDLAPGEGAFVQSTWSAGGEAVIGGAQRRLAFGALAGVTHDRALVARLPLASWWLREGVARDDDDWSFLLGTLRAAWEGSAGALRAEAFALARPASRAQARVDPAAGGRAGAEYRRRWFQDDLETRFRAEVAMVGERESEAPVPRRLPAFATFSAGVVLGLGDVVMVVDVRNLEDERRLQAWVDPVTGTEAPGPGREYRVTLSWRLFD